MQVTNQKFFIISIPMKAFRRPLELSTLDLEGEAISTRCPDTLYIWIGGMLITSVLMSLKLATQGLKTREFPLTYRNQTK